MIIGSVLLGILVSNKHQYAQEDLCDSDLLQFARGGPNGYRLRGDRCEGLYIEKLQGETLRVVSLTEYFEPFPVQQVENLFIEWKAFGDERVRLRAYSLRRRLYYRMDTTRPPGSSSYKWPSDVIASLCLSKDDLGLIGWTFVSGHEVFLPLRINQQSHARRFGEIQLKVVPGADVADVYISLASTQSDGSIGQFLYKDRPQKGYYPGERAFVIPISSTIAQGVYYMKIGARFKEDGMPTTAEVWFYHPGK